MSIRIIDLFVKLRDILHINTEMKLGIAEMKYTVEQIAKKQKGHDQNIELLFEYIDRLQDKQENIVSKPNSKGEIGFKIGEKK
ncbi:hypothetical protein [Sphingobacterium olei]|uniref:hypothetical protein n=1 Tax=Sphingobacterium olei TaxID=2571155 RepID=UPI001EE45EF7|nr:hypothetical protein [Sphingobacterium olei]